MVFKPFRLKSERCSGVNTHAVGIGVLVLQPFSWARWGKQLVIGTAQDGGPKGGEDIYVVNFPETSHFVFTI